MKNTFTLIIVTISLICFSCAPTITRYLPQNPPSMALNPASVDLELILPPPLFIQENKFKTLSRSVSQYFEIAIPPCVDMTSKSDYLRNSLADIFYTALFETKRFSLLDRMEMNKIQQNVNLDKSIIVTDSVKNTTRVGANTVAISKEEEMKQMENKTYQVLLDELKRLTDGLMMIYITSDKKSSNNSEGKVGVDYRIVSSQDGQVLFAGSKDIGYNYNEQTNSLEFSRIDINSVADSIKQKFPNPDYQEGLKIINKRGSIITINSGKKDNIVSGMMGYVIKVEKGANNENLIMYRAEFLVTEVFTDTFNAELLKKDPEDAAILTTITVNEPVKMK